MRQAKEQPSPLREIPADQYLNTVSPAEAAAAEFLAEITRSFRQKFSRVRFGLVVMNPLEDLQGRIGKRLFYLVDDARPAENVSLSVYRSAVILEQTAGYPPILNSELTDDSPSRIYLHVVGENTLCIAQPKDSMDKLISKWRKEATFLHQPFALLHRDRFINPNAPKINTR